MALQEFLDQLDQLVSEAESTFNSAANTEALEEARVEFLGAKNGKLKSLKHGTMLNDLIYTEKMLVLREYKLNKIQEKVYEI